MADQTAHHVVNSDRSTVEQSSVDAHANQDHTVPALAGNHPSSYLSKPAATTFDSSSSGDISSAPPTNDNSSYDAAKQTTIQTPSDKPGVDGFSTSEDRPNHPPQLGVNGVHDSVGLGPEDGLPDHNGSDTDTSRAGSIDQSKDENHPSKLSAIKKPTSFKPVSVTKTFLAKTAGAVSAPPKIGNKSPVPATVQPVAKPRLVAKSGSGLRDIPRVHSHDGTGAPDARMVWNKNQREHYPAEQASSYHHLLTRISSCTATPSKAVHR